MAPTGRRTVQTCIFKSAFIALVLLGLTSEASAQHSAPAGKLAVDPAIGSYATSASVSGSMVIVGSDTMQPLMVRIASVFRLRQPGIKISVQGGGSDAAIQGFLESQSATRRGDGNVIGDVNTNQVSMLASSRELSADERNRFISRHGYPPTAIPIAVDAVALYVSRDNPIAGLTLDQVDAMFSSSRNRGVAERLELWGQAGLSGEWQHAKIRLYGRDRNSGTRVFFKEHVLQNGEFSSSIQEEPGLASLLLAISKDRFGIGYGGIGFQISSVRAVPLAERTGAAFIHPTMEASVDGSYPLRRFLYLYVNHPRVTRLPEPIREFLAFVNSREGQEAVVKAGFYPLAVEQVRSNLVHLASSPSN